MDTCDDTIDESVMTEPTADTADRCWRRCLCRQCGTVALCTPLFDFYGTVPGEGFTCERCLLTRPPSGPGSGG